MREGRKEKRSKRERKRRSEDIPEEVERGRSVKLSALHHFPVLRFRSHLFCAMCASRMTHHAP